VDSPGDVLGERIGVGRTAEVFAWRHGEILKLLRPGFPERMGEREASIAALVDAAGLAAPRFLGTERVDGRYGLVCERVGGSSMFDRLSARPWLVDALAQRFAALHTWAGGQLGIEQVCEARPTGVGRALATYEIPIEGRDEWLAAARLEA
jgi:hypothetical protein